MIPKVPMFVAEAFMLSAELFGSVEAYSSMTKRATRLDREVKPEVGLENMTIERAGSRKGLADALVGEICGSHTRKLNNLRDSFNVHESVLL